MRLNHLLVTFILVVVALALPTPPRHDPSHDYNATVLILGGGVAGVIAARTLSRLSPHISFLIVEARDELGGRLQSHSFLDPLNGYEEYTVELGANWVHGTQTLGFDRVNPVWEMVGHWGIETVVSDYYGSMTTYDDSGPAQYLHLLNDSLVAYAKLVANSPTLTAHLPPSSDTRPPSSYEFDTSSARDGYDILGYRPLTPHERAAEYYTFDWEYADSPEKTSWWASGSSNNHTYEPSAGGFSSTNHFSLDRRGFKHFLLSEAGTFLRPDQVLLNSTVRAVRGNPASTWIESGRKQVVLTDEENEKHDGVEVMLANGQVLRAEYALCTFSLGVLQSGDVSWDAEFMPEKKRNAVKAMSMGVFTKIFLQFPSKFWFDTEFALYADPLERGRYPVWQSLDHPKFFPGSGILFVTVTGDFARRVDSMSEEDVKGEVLDVLRKMYPNLTIPDPIAFHIPHWLSDPLFRGSYSNWPATFTRAQHDLLRAKTGMGGEGRVWFAGEHTSERWFGFLHGAYYEGMSAAKDMVNCIDGNACEKVRNFDS